MAALLVRQQGGPSILALAEELGARLAGRGLPYHPRTLTRQLSGDVATVPREVEAALVQLAMERLGLADEAALAERLAAEGLLVGEAARRRARVPSRRVLPLVTLWLHLHPGRSRRWLAHRLAADLARRGIRLRPGYLQVALGGERRTLRLEVLEELLERLRPHGVATERAARDLVRARREELERSSAGRELLDSARLIPLVQAWQRRARGASVRHLATLVHEELARRGQSTSLDYLQAQLTRRRAGVRRAVLEALERVVSRALPEGRTLAEELQRASDRPEAAADTTWVAVAPIAELAARYLGDHPEVSLRELARRVAARARRLGFRTSPNTLQPVLAGRTTRTRGFVYRATARIVAPEASAQIPAEHVLDARLRHRLLAEQGRRGRGAPDLSLAVAPGRGAEPEGTPSLATEDRAGADAGAADALAAFRRDVGRIPPASRMEEVAAARAIEEGEGEILAALVGSEAGRRELMRLGRRLGRGEIPLRDLVRDYNDRALDPAARRAELLALFEAAGRGGGIDGPPLAEAFKRARLAWEPVHTLARRVLERAPPDPGQGDAAGPDPGLEAALVRGAAKAEAGRARLVLPYLWLVHFLARRQVGRGLPLADLVQEGALGLLRAAERFDYRQGHRFPTYATWWIRSSIARAIAEQGRTIRIPVSTGLTVRRVARERSRLAQELGREPSSQELALGMGLTVSQVRSFTTLSGRVTSLNQPVGEDGDAELGDFVASDGDGAADEAVAEADLAAALREALATLTPREQVVLRQRFGLEGADEHTLRALGDELGLSRERIRQIEAGALAKLRSLDEVKELEAYLHD